MERRQFGAGADPGQRECSVPADREVAWEAKGGGGTLILMAKTWFEARARAMVELQVGPGGIEVVTAPRGAAVASSGPGGMVKACRTTPKARSRKAKRSTR